MAAADSAASEVPVINSGGATTEEVGTAAAPSGWPPAVAERYKHAVLAGRGMFGRVYAAWDSVDGQLVAVKQLSGRTDDEFVMTGPREFAREVMALEACCGHPNVVKLLATFTDDDRSGNWWFIVTEFAGPLNLRRYLQQRHREDRPFGEREVRGVMAQLLSGVACAHHAGVVHREVVPENVVVDDDPWQQMMETKKKKKKARKYTICGFNASEQAGQPAKDGSTQLAALSPYRAPELFLGPSVVYDERIDTWGLGCIMAELVAGTGVPFFGGGSDAESLKGVLQVVGGKGLAEWPMLQRAGMPQEACKLVEAYSRDTGYLRAEFPKKKLSKAGFDVLSGLLESNPDRRLTAAAALKMPWFRRHGFAACFTSPVKRASS